MINEEFSTLKNPDIKGDLWTTQNAANQQYLSDINRV